MKKLLSSFILVLIILLIIWAVAGWYFGTKTEQEFRLLLRQNSQLVGKHFVRFELLNYTKTASGAKASLNLSSDYPVLAERMDNLELQVSLMNGPVLITRSGVSAGNSRWVLKLVDATAVRGIKSNIESKKAFSSPSAVVRIDFDNKAHYVAKFGASFADLLMTGIFDLETQNNRGAISLNKFILGDQPNVISADNINISYQHQKALTTQYKPGTASLQTAFLKIQHGQLSKPLILDIKMNSNISLKENALKGYLKADIRNVNIGANTAEFPVEKADVSLQFDGLPADALIAFSEANDDLTNLHQQAQWALEELGEVPEGQDQIWMIYDRIEESSNTLPEILAEKMGEDSSVNLKATTFFKGKSSSLDGEIKFNSNLPKISSWLSLLEGEAQVELDEYLLKTMQKFLPIKNPKFKLLLKDNQVLMAR